MASRYGKDDDHLAQVMELMGEFPKDFALSGKHSKEFFDDNGLCRPFVYQPADLHDF